MSDPKPFASLSSGLLARKGAARPAMRPQGFGQVGGGIDDLGWNDMGFEPPKANSAPRDASHDAFGEEIDDGHPHVHPTGLTPVQSPVHTQQAELADRLGGDDEEDAEFDETAELYDPEAASESDDDEEFSEEEEEARFEESAGDDTFELTETYEPTPAYQPVSAYEPIVAAVPPPAYESAPAFEAVQVPDPSPVDAPVRAPVARSVPGGKSKAAFTLRLDPDRHLKLRLACAVNGRSAQQIVTAAVDQLLRDMPELDAMAEKAKRKG